VAEGFSGLLVASGAITGFAALVLVGFAISHWLRARAERRERRPVRAVPAAPPAAPAPAAPAPVAPVPVAPPPVAPLPVLPVAPPPVARERVVSNAELRRWARTAGLSVADRGPIPARIRQAWAAAHPPVDDRQSGRS
jgi:hypothetical protein